MKLKQKPCLVQLAEKVGSAVVFEEKYVLSNLVSVKPLDQCFSLKKFCWSSFLYFQRKLFLSNRNFRKCMLSL